MLVLVYSSFVLLSVWCINRFGSTTLSLSASFLVAIAALIACVYDLFMLASSLLVSLAVWAAFKLTMNETADWE